MTKNNIAPNNLPDEILSEITRMASSLMQAREIAILLDLDIKAFTYIVKNKPDDPATIAFNKGRLQTKLELREKIIKLAKAGSPQAEVLADKYLTQE